MLPSLTATLIPVYLLALLGIIQKLSIGCAAFLFVFLFFLADANPRAKQRPRLLTNLTILMAYYFDRLTVKTIKSLAPPVTAIYVCIRIARTP